MTARSWPLYPSGDVVVSDDELADLLVADGLVFDRAESFRVPLAEFLYLPIFVAALRSFDPVGDHTGRAQIGRLVVRRAAWSARADELPDDLAGWARDRGLPRRVFVRSPLERKPRYVDFESPRSSASSRASSLRRASRHPARRSSSPRCCPALRTAGSRATPATTRASCESSPSTGADGVRCGYHRAAHTLPPSELDQARRTSMAAERTWLAWWRSALAASVGALGVGRLAPELLGVAAWPYVLLGCGYAGWPSGCSSAAQSPA